jgi:hypothetical protein
LLRGLIKSIKDLLCAAQRAGGVVVLYISLFRPTVYPSIGTHKTDGNKKKEEPSHEFYRFTQKDRGGKNPGFSTDSRNSSSSHHRKLPPLKPGQNLERVQLPRAFSRTQGEKEDFSFIIFT